MYFERILLMFDYQAIENDRVMDCTEVQSLLEQQIEWNFHRLSLIP